MAQGDVLNIIKNRPRNRIINGAMDFAQRISGFVDISGAAFAVDRYYHANSGASGGTQRVSIDSTYPIDRFTKAMKIETIVASNMSDVSSYVVFRQSIEGNNIADLFGKRVSIGFWVRSSVVGIYSCVVETFNPSNRSYAHEYTINAADTWEYKTIENFYLDPTYMNGETGTGVGLSLVFALAMGSARKQAPNTWISNGSQAVSSTNQVNFVANVGNIFEITGIQLNEGPICPEFERAGTNIANELQLCQRYFEKSYSLDTIPGATTNSGAMAIIAGDVITDKWSVVLKVTKRVVPLYNVLSPTTGASLKVDDDGGEVAVGIGNVSDGGFIIQSDGWASGSQIQWHWTADAEL